MRQGPRHRADKAPGPSQPLPFDHARAHKLYTALFGEVQDLIKGKHLLIVPSGPLTQLPFQVLVTKPPTSGDHRAAAWLAREHAITVLPAVSSLEGAAPRRQAQRRIKADDRLRQSAARRDPTHATPSRAKLAREKQRCPRRASQQVADARWLSRRRGSESRHAAAWPTCRTSRCRCPCPRPPTSCALWPRM